LPPWKMVMVEGDALRKHRMELEDTPLGTKGRVLQRNAEVKPLG